MTHHLDSLLMKTSLQFAQSSQFSSGFLRSLFSRVIISTVVSLSLSFFFSQQQSHVVFQAIKDEFSGNLPVVHHNSLVLKFACLQTWSKLFVTIKSQLLSGARLEIF